MAFTASEETWAEARRLWQATLLKPGEIAARTGVHHLPLSRRARREGWPRPAEAALAEAVAAEDGNDDALMADRTPATRRARSMPARRKSGEPITTRLLRLANRNLDFLEDQMEHPDGMKEPEERERVTKAIDVTTRIVDKLSELRTHDQRAGSATSDKPAILAGADLERRRHEIADRLERILAKRNPAPGPGGAAG